MANIASPKAQSTFPSGLCPHHGIFYEGWANLLHASILRVKNKDAITPSDLSTFELNCDKLAACFEESPSPYLESYEGSCWPADAFTGIASLAIHDKKFPPRYEKVVSNWTAKTKNRLDDHTGLIPHSVHSVTGQPGEGARGSSQSLILWLYTEIDPVQSLSYYRVYRKKFVKKFMGTPGIREYPKGKTGLGDIDSGPVLFDIGAAGTIVAIAAARANGDFELAKRITQLVECIGFPLQINGKKTYAFGILPVGDAFLCWAKATLPSSDSKKFKATPHFSPLPFHFTSVFIIIILFLPVFVWKKRKKELPE